MVCTRWKWSAAPACSSSRRAAPACSDRSSGGKPNCWHSELGAQSGRKNQPACFLVSLVNYYYYYYIRLMAFFPSAGSTICKSFAPRSRQITMPVPHHSVFTGLMPFLPPNQQRQSTEGIITTQNKHKKTKAKFSRLLRQLAWKWRGRFWFWHFINLLLTYFDTHLITAP